MNKLNVKLYNTCVGDKPRKIKVDPNQHGKKITNGRGSIVYIENR